MSYGKCERCGEMHWDDEACKELFRVLQIEDDGTVVGSKKILADNSHDAAKKYGKHYDDCNKACLLLTKSIKVNVTGPTGKEETYIVCAEQEVNYFASAIKKEKQ